MIHFELSKWLDSNQKPNRFYDYPAQKEPDLDGFLVVAREHFFRIDGFDEAFHGWGRECKDLRERLERIGLSLTQVPLGSVSSIPHGDELRQLDKGSGGYGSKREAMAINHLPNHQKDAGHSQNRNRAGKARSCQFIRTLNNETCMKGESSFEISINIPINSKYNKFSRSQRTLSYRVPVTQPIQ